MLLSMREDELRRYFLGEISISQLAADLEGSVTVLDSVASEVHIRDMQDSFRLTRPHLLMLCEAFLDQGLKGDALNTLAFALVASDTYEWEDDVISKVLSDWSAPEINYELNADTITMHREWLLNLNQIPRRGTVPPSVAENAYIRSVRTKRD